MGNKSVADTLKNFYGHRLQQDDSRTARLYLNTNKVNSKSILIAKGYSSPSSVSISHTYNEGSNAPKDAAQIVYDAANGAASYLRQNYSKINQFLNTAKGWADFILPSDSAAQEFLTKGEEWITQKYGSIQKFISIFESNRSAYEEVMSYVDTRFDLSPNLTIVLYPRLTGEDDFSEDFSYLLYNSRYISDSYKNKLISPASQLKTLLTFLTGRTEYLAVNTSTTEEEAMNESSASSNGQTVFIPNPLSFLGSNIAGVSLRSDVDLVNSTGSSTDFVRYRRIRSPNDYTQTGSTYAYGINGTFRLLSGGIGSGKIIKSGEEIEDSTSKYGSASRSSTGCNFYDNLLISNVQINNSDTVMKMQTYDFESDRYIEEITPEYITITLSFAHSYTKYDFDELYWALGLSSLEDMKSLSKLANKQNQANDMSGYTPVSAVGQSAAQSGSAVRAPRRGR